MMSKKPKCYTSRYGSKFWMADRQLHRLDGPAMELCNRKEWWVDGKRHRLDGPAVEWADGSKEWYVDDKRVSEQGFPDAVLTFLLGPEVVSIADFDVATVIKCYEQECHIGVINDALNLNGQDAAECLAEAFKEHAAGQ